jgi:uridine kinase
MTTGSTRKRFSVGCSIGGAKAHSGSFHNVMANPDDILIRASGHVIEAVRSLLARKRSPIAVALDGASGAGKSTLASAVQRQVDAVLVPLDDFFSAKIPDSQWDEFTVQQRLNHVFDWQRARESALEPLRAGKEARWYAFDFSAGLQPDGTYGMQTNPKEYPPRQVILLEGAYSAHPLLADLVDLAVLVDTPATVRHERLASREDKDFLQRWHNRWDPVERYYLSHVRPKSSFNVVVTLV